MRYAIWKVLVWIDNSINHTIVDSLFGLSHSDIMFRLWKNTSRRFCNWVILTLGEDKKWNVKG